MQHMIGRHRPIQEVTEVFPCASESPDFMALYKLVF